MEDSSQSQPWTLLPSWMSTIESERWQRQIKENLFWKQPLIRVYGSSYLVPRKTTFLAEKNICYRYSGLTNYGLGLPDWFHPLLDKVILECQAQFNGCLLNLYRNGDDRMGWHSDDEPEIDRTKPIASLSLGATRDFFFKHRTKKIREVLTLKQGDLLIMHPNCQKNWLHSVPIRKKIAHERINLTFRCYFEDD